MTDFDDDLRRAVAGAAAGTVAPPFDTVERRARARRHRQAAGVAAGVVAVLAAGALAMPGRGAPATRPAAPASPSPTATGWLKPYADLAGDPAAKAVVERCLEFRKTLPGTFPDKMKGHTDSIECHRLAGYEAPRWDPEHVTAETDVAVTAEPDVCGRVPAPASAGVRTVASGDTGVQRWWVVAWDGPGGTKCVGPYAEPAADPTVYRSVESPTDSGPAGALRPVDSQTRLDGAGTGWMLYWGAVAPHIVKVAAFTEDDYVVARLLDDGDRRYYGVAVKSPEGGGSMWVAGYDAAGIPMGVRAPSPAPATP